MKKMIQLMVLVLSICAPLMASAQGKIAVLDVQTAILQTELAKKEFKTLQARPDFAANIKQLETLQKDYTANVEKLKKDSAVMSDAQKQTEAQKLQSSLTDIQHVRKKLETAQQELAKKLMQALSPKLKQVIPEIIKSEGIGMLLDRKAVMHADESYDVTAKVTAKLNL